MEGDLKSTLFTKKNIFGILAFILISLGITAGLFLLNGQKLFNPKADIEPITFKDANGNPLQAENGVPITNSTNIKVELRAPAP